ncbi:MAG: hypothetical protein K9W46_05210 [Candidatus Heimdallarchaeum endolithica]|uniref:Cyclophilin TM1367-like domain-containing protein n=1 Tax=Candidatus Heimdallarchaeum endolithica TaxID=2876572 RepID=A0A9Y1FQB6_9ARCH|nr:MAG: hypothetical protein K9W46_05210 [Candidatus Heimdallarchaeum endolithica]
MIGVNYHIKMIIPNKGEINAELIRIKAPQLTEQLVRILPLNTRAIRRGNIFLIPINQTFGIEKPIKKVKKSDLVYDPKSQAILIILENTELDFRVAQIGTVVKNLELIQKLKTTVGVRIESLNQ